MRGMNSESVDLIATDPPFDSKRIHNSLDKDTRKAKQQFKDRWRWDEVTGEWQDVIATDHPAIKEIIEAIAVIEGGKIDEGSKISTGRTKNSKAAYIAYMAPRIIEMHRLLKPSGVLFLHCDHKANAYLRLLLDAVFGRSCLINEIVRRRQGAKSNVTRRLPNNHDTIFAYGKTRNKWKWNPPREIFDIENVSKKTLGQYDNIEGNRKYGLHDLTNPNPDRPNLTYEFLGVTRVWKMTRENMEDLYKQGRIVQTKPGNVPRRKKYLDEKLGKMRDALWTDVWELEASTLKWATRKPLALYRRLIECATNEGDLVLDPFCGCATTCVAAEQLGRRWIGIDIDHEADNATKRRLEENTGLFSETDGYRENHRPVTVKKTIPKRNDIQRISDQKMRYALWQNQRRRCGNPYCDSKNVRQVDLHLDHRIPKSRGGPDDMTNRIGLCGDCNRRKGRKAWGAFLGEERAKQPHPTVTQ